MTEKIKNFDKQCMEAYTKIVDHCHGDMERVGQWFGQVNAELKSSPMNMIGRGRTQELNRYIDQKIGRKK